MGKKLDLKDVEKIFNNYGLYIENSNDYISANKNITTVSKNGFKYYLTIYNLKKNKNPSIYQKNPYAYYNFSIICKNNNLELIEKEWKGSRNNHLVKTIEGYFTYAKGDLINGGFLIKCFTTENPYTIQNIHTFCKINNLDYQLISDKYINSNDLLIWKYTGNEYKNLLENQRYFKMSLNAFKDQNQRFPLLNISKAEQKIENILNDKNIKYQREFTFIDCKNKRVLPFDFAIFKNNNSLKFICEYDGLGHYQPVNFGGMSDEKALENYKYIKNNDNIKTVYCQQNNISLLRIPYYDFDNIEEILDKELNKYKDI